MRPHRSIPITSSSLQARGMPSRVLSGQTSTSVDSGQRSRLKKRSKSQNEDDTLFDLDGFHESRNCEPFFESDEDSSGKYFNVSFSPYPKIFRFKTTIDENCCLSL